MGGYGALRTFYEHPALYKGVVVHAGHPNLANEWLDGEHPESTDLDHFGFTNKRWSTYQKPPIEELLAINIPIYAMFATEDESTPIETAYLIPIQFMEKKKANLTFDVCIDCNHSYIQRVDKNDINHWDKIFAKFIDWTEEE